MSRTPNIDESHDEKQYTVKVSQCGRGNFVSVRQSGAEISGYSPCIKTEFIDGKFSSAEGTEIPGVLKSVKVDQSGNGNVVSIRSMGRQEKGNLSGESV